MSGVIDGAAEGDRAQPRRRVGHLHRAAIGQRAFERGEIHVDRHVAVGVTIHLNAGAMHALHPRVQLSLRLGYVALVRRAGIRRAQRHRALGEGTVHRMLRRGAKANPVVAKARFDPVGDHRIEGPPRCLVVDAMTQLAACAHILHRGEVAAFVMHGRESVACELLRDVRHPIALALVPVGVTELRALASGIQHAHRAIGHTSGEFPCTILVERPAGGRQRVLGDLGQLERLAVVERGVSAAVAHHDRMLG